METLEPFAKISLVAHLLGGARQLPADAVAKLVEVRERAGYMGGQPRPGQACSFTPRAARSTNGDETITLTRAELIRLVEEGARALRDGGR
jgi:hypothetical protein